MALKMADSMILRLTFLIYFFVSLVSGQQSPLYARGTNYLTQSRPNQAITLPQGVVFPFYGKSYSTLYISEDGMIGFSQNIDYTADRVYGTQDHLYSAADDYPFIAPFIFGAHSINNPVSGVPYDGKVYYRQITQSSNSQELLLLGQYINDAFIGNTNFVPRYGLIVTWVDVTDQYEISVTRCTIQQPPAGQKPCKKNTFQAAVLTDGTNSYAIFNYQKMDIPTNPSYQAGFNAGGGRGWTEAMSSSDVQTANILQGSNVTGRFLYKIDSEAIVKGGCNGRRQNTGTLQVTPRYGGMFGGAMLDISGPCLGPNDIIKCKFAVNNDPGQQQISAGFANSPNNMKGRCEIPKLIERGQVVLSMSVDEGMSYYYSTNITIVHPSRMQRYVTLPNGGTGSMWNETSATSLTVNWDRSVLTNDTTALVDVLLVGYKEMGGSGQWSMQLSLCQSVSVSSGSCTFSVSNILCNADCNTYEIGVVTVRLQNNRVATKHRSINSNVIPLGWLMNRNMVATYGSNWPQQKCQIWSNNDRQDTSWLSRLQYCPCTLQQALGDFGRWQTDVGCDLYSTSPTKCGFHIGAVHCIRAVQPTGQEGAGNQCCYGASGALMYSADSFQGSTPDRSHDWGAFPYLYTDKVPSMSHWLQDVITFYYCCLWTGYNNCDTYMDLRATRDCTGYTPPKQAMVFGQSHVMTFDGSNFRVCAEGDFILMQGNSSVTIEGRFQKPLFNTSGNMNNSVTLTDVGIAINDERIELRLRPQSLSLKEKEIDVLVNNRFQSFKTKSMRWQDFKEVAIVNNENAQTTRKQFNFTVIAKNGIGIQVAKQDNGLTLIVVIPSTMKGTVNGLLGDWNGNKTNDFIPKGDTTVVQNNNLTVFYSQYQYSWAVQSKTQSIVPFTILAKNTSSLCSMGPTYSSQNPCSGNVACQFDLWSTGNQNLALNTRRMFQRYAQLTQALQPVRTCGLLNVPRSYKNNKNYTLGSSVTITGCRKGSFSGTSTYTCVSTGNSSQAWTPYVNAVCSTDNVEGANVGMIVGIVVAIGVLILVIVIAFVVVLRAKKAKKKRENYKPRIEESPNPPQAEYKSVPVEGGGQKMREYTM